MKVFNLAKPDSSDFEFKVAQYPDGQQNILVTATPLLSAGESVEIRSHFSNFRDLELILCVVAYLKEWGVKWYSLYVPYFLGARSDEKFESGGNYYLEDVVCPIIKSQGFEKVTVMDPHSAVLRAALRPTRVVSRDNHNLVRFALVDLYGSVEKSRGKFNFVSPDGGSLKKIYKVEDDIGYVDTTVVGAKSRDANGKLSKIVLSDNYHYEKDIIWVDDICDGGRTFVEQARPVKENPNFKGRIILVVTHGIFSAGTEQLSTIFDKIYTTNSYKREFSPGEVLVQRIDVF